MSVSEINSKKNYFYILGYVFFDVLGPWKWLFISLYGTACTLVMLSHFGVNFLSSCIWINYIDPYFHSFQRNPARGPQQVYIGRWNLDYLD